jgi:hypothetical protein
MVDRRYPFERVGRFQCSDELLNRLWERAVNTIEVVSDDAYGSDARERNEWLQDPAEPNFITTRVALAGPGADGKPLYSDPRLLKNLLRHAALTQLADGRILATFPTDRGQEDCHYVIEDYSCQWVEALWLFFEATGDRSFLQEVWPVLVKQMDWFLERRTARGLVLSREYTSFDDPLAYITCEGAALNAFVYQALRDSAELARVLEDKIHAAGYTRAATALAESFNKELWNAAEGTYDSGLVKDKRLGPTAHAALMALDRGIAAQSRRESVRRWFLAHYQRPGGFHVCTNPDFEQMVADRAGINMPVSYYWVFQELYRMDSPAMDREALNGMRRRWGQMVRESDDTGTLWETFGGPESCHNYGAVPAYFLSSYVLGVRLDGPVWNKRLLIEPRLGDLASAEGVVVTEFGPVPVLWRRQGDELVFHFVLPKGVKAALRLPDGDAATLVLDGRKARAETRGRYVTAEVGAGAHEGRLAMKPHPAAGVGQEIQRAIARVQRMAQVPEPLAVRDWPQVSRQYYELLLNSPTFSPASTWPTATRSSARRVTAAGQYDVRHGGRLVVRSVYHGRSSDAFNGLHLADCGMLSIDATRFSYATPPTVAADNFRGLFTLATCILMPVETKASCRFELRGDGSGASVLVLNNQFWIEQKTTADDV